MLHHSVIFAAQVGHIPAIVYDYMARWISYNANANKLSSLEDGKIWTYGTLDFYCGQLALNPRTFQATMKFLVEQGYLKIKHKGKGGKKLWICLGTKMPNIPAKELPYEEQFFEFFSAANDSSKQFGDNLSTENSFNADFAQNDDSFNADFAQNNLFDAKSARNISFDAKSALNNTTQPPSEAPAQATTTNLYARTKPVPPRFSLPLSLLRLLLLPIISDFLWIIPIR